MYGGIEIWTYAIGSLALVSLAAGSSALVLCIRACALVREQKDTIAGLRRDIQALCAGAADVDQRIGHMHGALRRFDERQEQLELRDKGERLYHQAIRMVENGAKVDEVIAACELSRGEAELIARMHRVEPRRAAG